MKSYPELKIAIAGDHAGYALKQHVLSFLEAKGATVHDFGCFSVESCDYPDFIHPMATAVEQGEYDYGVAVCSTGNGVAMCANHHPAIRAALCWDVPLAQLARQHNNANVLCMPANFVTVSKALEMVEMFFSSDFEGGRHERRVQKIVP